jgi:hypothetical protein
MTYTKERNYPQNRVLVNAKFIFGVDVVEFGRFYSAVLYNRDCCSSKVVHTYIVAEICHFSSTIEYHLLVPLTVFNVTYWFMFAIFLSKGHSSCVYRSVYGFQVNSFRQSYSHGKTKCGSNRKF